ncbi:MAG: ferrous iron transport protein A, partial [Paraglaciecola sp.]
MSQLTLWDIKKKQVAKVDGLDPTLTPSVQRRLSEMGFSSGQDIQCLRRSPFKG